MCSSAVEMCASCAGMQVVGCGGVAPRKLEGTVRGERMYLILLTGLGIIPVPGFCRRILLLLLLWRIYNVCV